MSIRTYIKEPIAERSSARITAVLKDEAGNSIPASRLSSLTLTIYNLVTGEIFNNRDRINILNTNGGTVDSNGNLTYQMTPDDNAIGATERYSERCLLFEWTWEAGAKVGRHEVIIKIENLRMVT